MLMKLQIRKNALLRGLPGGVVAVLLASALPSPGGPAPTLHQFDLEGLVENAERIFLGRCEAASTLKLHGLICTRYVSPLTRC